MRTATRSSGPAFQMAAFIGDESDDNDETPSDKDKADEDGCDDDVAEDADDGNVEL